MSTAITPSPKSRDHLYLTIRHDHKQITLVKTDLTFGLAGQHVVTYEFQD